MYRQGPADSLPPPAGTSDSMATITKRRLVYRCAGSAAEECAFLKAQVVDYWIEALSLRWRRAMSSPQGTVAGNQFKLRYFPQRSYAWSFGRGAVTIVGRIQETTEGVSVEVEEVHDPGARRIHTLVSIVWCGACTILFPLLVAVLLRFLNSFVLIASYADLLRWIAIMTATAGLALITMLVSFGSLLRTVTVGKSDDQDSVLRFKSLVSPRWELVSEEVVG